jgi:DNA-binding winged helix-turn-helix (wHTH) protein
VADRNSSPLSFGPYELSIGNRLLTNGTRVVPLGARAMDLLVVLVERANQVVSQRTLARNTIKAGIRLSQAQRASTTYDLAVLTSTRRR